MKVKAGRAPWVVKTIRIDPPLVDRIQHTAIKRGTTFSDVIRAAIMRALKYKGGV